MITKPRFLMETILPTITDFKDTPDRYKCKHSCKLWVNYSSKTHKSTVLFHDWKTFE